MASASSQRLGARLLASPNLTEPAQLYRQLEGSRNDYGEFIPGGFLEQDVTVITAPMSGEERAILPEALRDLETRKFWVTTPVENIDLTHVIAGDAILWNNRAFRAAIVKEWGGFREVLATFPSSADLGDIMITRGAFSIDFSSAFDVVRTITV